MALTQIYSANAGDTITAARWNNEFGNIYTNGTDVAFPATKAVSFAGYTLTLDASGATTLSSPTNAGLLFTPGSKTGTPGTNGSVLTIASSTFTDSNTAAGGTASLWNGVAIRKPTLVATNLNVTTTIAASLYIEDAPVASTNETITNPYALYVAAGNSRLAGNLELYGTLTMNGKSIITAEGAAVASAGTTNIWTTDGNTVHITGTTTITSLGTAPQAGATKWIIFDDALTLTHGANLNIPGAASITTAAGDVARVYADTTTQLDIQLYTRSDGTNVAAPRANQGSSLVYISSTTLSSSGIVTGIDSTYAEYVIQLIAVRPSNNAVQFELVYSADGGSTFANSNYTATLFGSSLGGTTEGRLFSNVSNTADEGGVSGSLHLYDFSSAVHRKMVKFSLVGQSTVSGTLDAHGSITCVDAAPQVLTAAVNAVKFQFSAGTIAAGTARLYGVKNS